MLAVLLRRCWGTDLWKEIWKSLMMLPRLLILHGSTQFASVFPSETWF